jgi:GTPase SAR1 family protein
VGKSSLLERYVYGKFSGPYQNVSYITSITSLAKNPRPSPKSSPRPIFFGLFS